MTTFETWKQTMEEWKAAAGALEVEDAISQAEALLNDGCAMIETLLARIEEVGGEISEQLDVLRDSEKQL